MNFSRIISIELMAIAGVGLAAGTVLGVGATSAFYIAQASSLSADLANKTLRVRVLESLITAAPDSFGATSLLAQAPTPSASVAEVVKPAPAPDPAPVPAPRTAPGAAPAPAPAPTQPAPQAPKPKVEPTPSVKPVPVAVGVPAKPAPAPASPPAPAPVRQVAAPIQPPPVPAPVQVVAASPTDVESVSAAEIQASTSKNPVVGVSSERLGVARVEPGGVRLRNGNFIRVGQRFSNGERLLQVDVTNNRIVTSDRQLLIFFSATE